MCIYDMVADWIQVMDGPYVKFDMTDVWKMPDQSFLDSQKEILDDWFTVTGNHKMEMIVHNFECDDSHVREWSRSLRDDIHHKDEVIPGGEQQWRVLPRSAYKIAGPCILKGNLAVSFWLSKVFHCFNSSDYCSRTKRSLFSYRATFKLTLVRKTPIPRTGLAKMGSRARSLNPLACHTTFPCNRVTAHPSLCAPMPLAPAFPLLCASVPHKIVVAGAISPRKRKKAVRNGGQKSRYQPLFANPSTKSDLTYYNWYQYSSSLKIDCVIEYQLVKWFYMYYIQTNSDARGFQMRGLFVLLGNWSHFSS